MDIRYPTGRYQFPDEVTPAIRATWIDASRAVPQQLQDAASGLTEVQLDTPYRKQGWSPRQIVHHVADSYMNSYTRCKWTLTEDTPTFPYLFDETQVVAKAYAAACTPDFLLFDSEQELVYRGQLDDSRPRNEEPVTGASLRSAINAVLAGQPVSGDQKPSMGCGIKWKPGNEPGV